MESLATYISGLRHKEELSVKKLAERWGIDASLASRFEGGQRIPSKHHVESLITTFGLDQDAIYTLWYTDQVIGLIDQAAVDPSAILEAAETRIEYLKGSKAFAFPKVSEEISERLKQVDHLHKKWNALRPLQGTQLKKMRSYFNTSYTYESNKIEGNTLTLQETMLVIQEGLTISGKTLNEHLEAINHAAASDYMLALVHDTRGFDKRTLLEIHNLILQSIDRLNAGRYRSVPVRITGSDHIPPQPYLLDKLMEDYFNYHSEISKEIHPVILAAEVHERLVSIHPFIDGNGRTARLVMNLILLQHGYSIAILKGDAESRMAYYQSLEQVQLNANPEPFYHLIIDRCIASLKEHIELAGV